MCHRPGSEPRPCPRQEAQKSLSCTPSVPAGPPDTLAGTGAWHPLGAPEGFRGSTQHSAPCQGGATAGCSPFTPLWATSPHPSGTSTPLRHFRSPPGTSTLDKAAQSPAVPTASLGRAGEVATGRASAPWSHPTGSTSTSPACLAGPSSQSSTGRWWHIKSWESSRRVKAEGSGLTFNVTQGPGVCAMAELGGEGPMSGQLGTLGGGSSPQAGSWHSHGGQGWALPWGPVVIWGARGGSEVAAGLALAGQPIEEAQPRPVALVQPPHAVTLVVDVVGDVLQVLQV